MKNMLCIVLALLLCLLIASCHVSSPAQIPESMAVPSGNPGETESDGSDTESHETDMIEVSPVVENICNSLEEYRIEVGSIKLPAHFVSYDDLAQLGAFDYFMFKNPESPYGYGLVDQAGNTIGVGVYPGQSVDAEKLTYAKEDQEDMRFLPSVFEGVAYQRIGDLVYCYQDGRLIEMMMQNGTNKVVISYNSDSAIENGVTTGVSKLLSRSTAEATAKALCEAFRDTTN